MFDATKTQQALVKHGFSIAIDGQAGPRTFAAILATISARPLERVPLAGALAVALVARLPEADITTPLRVRHFLAQAACETAGFTRLKEWDGGDPHYFDKYNGRGDLGNTKPGDGPRYAGRGFLDTTGRYNYTVLAGLTGLDCVDHPEILEQPDPAVEAAVKYWQHHNANPMADRDDIVSVTHAINGGLNGLADRRIFLSRAAIIQ